MPASHQLPDDFETGQDMTDGGNADHGDMRTARHGNHSSQIYGETNMTTERATGLAGRARFRGEELLARQP
ncbi:hypothetical protein Acor_07580 [Acrocarpospora corrugata]|uniref:Uncharacterized protein n=1 Tax=Acrocarpospora corrugata TaxID=35763 RepID=A0A5M3VPI1_9ACTN|nr:hypothetical protein Acor_07580 [Acrocarpospora corrugata]